MSTRPMDLTQATQRIGFLDEEHRRNRSTIQELQQAIERQVTSDGEQTARIGQLEENLRKVTAQVARVAQVEELVARLSGQAEAAQSREAELSKRLDAEAKHLRTSLEAQARDTSVFQPQIEDLRRQVVDRKALVKVIEDGRAERDRLIAAVQTLGEMETRLQTQSARMRVIEEQFSRMAADLDQGKHQAERLGERIRDQQDRFMVMEKGFEQLQSQIGNLFDLAQNATSEIAQLSQRLITSEQRVQSQIVGFQPQLDNQQQHLDELVSQVGRISDVAQRSAQEIGETSPRVEHLQDEMERVRTLVMAGSEESRRLRVASESQATEHLRLIQEQRALLASIGSEHADDRREIARLSEELDDNRRRLADYVALIRHMEEQHRHRQILELEQQIKEYNDRFSARGV